MWSHGITESRNDGRTWQIQYSPTFSEGGYKNAVKRFYSSDQKQNLTHHYISKTWQIVNHAQEKQTVLNQLYTQPPLFNDRFYLSFFWYNQLFQCQWLSPPVSYVSAQNVVWLVLNFPPRFHSNHIYDIYLIFIYNQYLEYVWINELVWFGKKSRK